MGRGRKKLSITVKIQRAEDLLAKLIAERDGVVTEKEVVVE